MFYQSSVKELTNKKQKASDLNVDCENNKRIKYNYKINDQILLNCERLQQKLVPERDGLYQVIRVYSNGTLKIQKGIYVQQVSISRCIPYFKSSNEGKQMP